MSSTGDTAPLSNVAQIPLPPGMNLAEFQDLQAHLRPPPVGIAITTSAAFGIVAWDYFIQLPDEFSLYRSKDRNIWKSPATWWFIVLRYSGIIATLPSLFFTVVQTELCQVAISTSAAGAVLTTASSGAIFGYRVRALWNGSILVSVVVGLFYVIMIACWITVSTQFRGDTGPHTSILSNCQLHPEAPWSPISYASSVAFDTCVFIFTVVKFRGNFDTFKSKVNRQIYNDSLLYFFLQTATNIVVLSIQTQRQSSFNLIKPATVPFSTLMTVTMGTRVFLNLRLFNRRQEQLNAPSLPVQVQYSEGAKHPTSGSPPIVFTPLKNTHASHNKNGYQ